ncbi:hypothetical protein [Elizabethkingia anophelis]|uniref:hypothetical protein n=1 Tax=Elizabethkingia anophelis TaxID=1117645 RepID=UPI0021A27F7C
MKELHLAGFIVYSPSYNVYKGSFVEIIDFGESEVFINTAFSDEELSEQKANHFCKPEFYEVELYFKERDLISIEANKFYSFYDSLDWKLSGGKLMNSWQAAARKWIAKQRSTVR